MKIQKAVIELSWPDSSMLPNRSKGKSWYTTHDAKIIAHNVGYVQAMGFNIGDTNIDHAVTIIIAPPDKRKRDVDGIHAALKPVLDGIAQALGIDDYHFNPVTLRRIDPATPGSITIIVEDSIPF